MKGRLLILISLLAFGFLSCGNVVNPHKTELKPFIEAIEKTDNCSLNPLNIYEIHIPPVKNEDEKLPLLVIIDAHGNGKFALDKFRAGAEKYQVVIAASDYVKNGFVNYAQAIEMLLSDVQQKYPVNQTVILAGFSGGARMALGFALNRPVNGLILCGALANADEIIKANCPVFSISGTDDFNFVETAQFLFQEQLIPGNLKIELINASHTWPDSLVLADALGFLSLSTVGDETSSIRKSQFNAYCEKQKGAIDSLKARGEFLKAALKAHNLSTTRPFNTENLFATLYTEIKAGTGYKQQLNNLEKCLNFELKMRQPYLEAFSTKDSIWWKREIKSVNEQIENEKDAFSKDMYKRIKGFWGIACFSLGNQAITEKNSVALNKIVSVYRMLEPENAYGIYFSAFPYFWKGDVEKTIAILKKAHDVGFNDLNQMKSDFPESVYSKIQ